MSHEDPLKSWMEARRHDEVPESFEASVMGRVREEAAVAASGSGSWLQQPFTRAAIWVVAGLLLVMRLSAVFAIFFAGCAGRA